MTLAISPITPALAALAADLGVVLQPGTVVAAQVLQLLDNNLVRIAIAGLTIDVATVKPLRPGQTLQLAVTQSPNGLSLTPVTPEATTPARGAAVIVNDIPLAPRIANQPAPIEPTLTPPETRAVAVAAQAAVTKQAGLSPLFANLSAAVASGTLPQPVLIAAAQLLGLRLPSTKVLTGGDIKAALQLSGLTMEAALALPTANPPPDIKSALLVLRQTLATWVGPDAENASAPPPSNSKVPVQVTTFPANPEPSVTSAREDTRTAEVETTAAALRAFGAADDSEPVIGPKNLLAVQLIASAMRPAVKVAVEQPTSHAVPPPVRGAAPAAQIVASPTLVPDAEPSSIARQLVADTEGALARQTLLQIASLPVTTEPGLRNDPMQPRWNFEIPFITPQGTAMAQFEIARDGSGNEAEASQRVWRARFSLDIEPAGPVHALIAFSGETISVKMWAERPATAAQLRANASQLTESLDRVALKASEVVVADGAPSRGRSASAGHFLNRAT